MGERRLYKAILLSLLPGCGPYHFRNYKYAFFGYLSNFFGLFLFTIFLWYIEKNKLLQFISLLFVLLFIYQVFLVTIFNIILTIKSYKKKESIIYLGSRLKRFSFPIFYFVSILFLFLLTKAISPYIYEDNFRRIVGPSMKPNIFENDILFSLGNIKFIKTGLIYGIHNADDIYIKRLIGIAEDTIEVTNGRIKKNGEEFKYNYIESFEKDGFRWTSNDKVEIYEETNHRNMKYYVFLPSKKMSLNKTIVLKPKENEAIFLGDNRVNSHDSRSENFGKVLYSDIKENVLSIIFNYKALSIKRMFVNIPQN